MVEGSRNDEKKRDVRGRKATEKVTIEERRQK
jgi:hypothetical protein